MTEPLVGADLTAWRLDNPDDVVAAALATVRGYCEWHIAPSRTETVTLDGQWATVFLLPSLRVTAVTSVTLNGVAMLASGFEWSAAGVLRLRTYYPGTSTTSLRNVVVQMTHGYDTLPGEVRQIVLDVADRGSTPANIRQVGDITLAVGVGDAPAGSVLTEAERKVLERYRLPVLA